MKESYYINCEYNFNLEKVSKRNTEREEEKGNKKRKRE